MFNSPEAGDFFVDNETILMLIRHATTEWNKNHRYLGHTDLPLNRQGIDQAKKLNSRLRGDHIDVVYTSTAQRARQTSDRVFQGKNIAIIPNSNLIEINFGKWEGLTYKEITKKYPRELSLWEENPLTHSPPEGESMGRVRERVELFYKEILRKQSGKSIALVGHGGSFNILLCYLLGIRPKAKWQFQLSPGSISEVHLTPTGDIVITKLNHIF